VSGLVLLYRLILRPLFRQPGRALVVLFAVALGDAAVVAIELAGDAAAGSFHSSIEALAGKSTFEVTAAGGVPQAVAARLNKLPYPLEVSPRIEDHALVTSTGQAVPLIGLDLIGAANNETSNSTRQMIGAARLSEAIRGINAPDGIWVTSGLAPAAGAHLSLLIDDRTRTYVVRGFLPAAAQVNGDAVLMDIGAAQAATGKLGRVDRILIRTPGQGDFATWERRLRSAAPPGVLVNAQGAETAANRRMLAAFRWNLRILSYIALLVGAFLIYSALSVSVVRRRPEIGTMRALGASRNGVLLAFLAEAAAFGTLGSLMALPLGRLLAAGAVQMLSATVNALYVSSRPGPMSITAGSVALALIVGIGVSCLSALVPAREASRVPPTEAMARGRREYEVRVERKRDAWIALGLALGGAAATQAPELGGKPMMGYLAALLFVAAAAMLTPLVVQGAMDSGSGSLRRLIGMEGLLASRSLGGSLRRSSVLVAALATAIAMMTSVGIMVGSFRETVLTWMQTELPADLYLRPAGWAGGDQHPTMSPAIADRIAQAPGVAAVRRLRAYNIQYQGLPATLAGAEPIPAGGQQALRFLSGGRGADIFRELASGNFAVVSEPFASKHHVKAGMSISLPLGERKVTFRILGVFYDYGDEAGLLLVDWKTLLRYLPDPAPSNLAVYLAPGTNLEQARVAIQKTIGNANVLVFSNREIRRQGMRVFDQTFAITYALEAISILVAVGGIAGSLVSLVIDRSREFGVLRFLGATGRQIRRLILVEAGLIGLLASAIGLALGVVLSLVLVFVINKQSFGWTIQFYWPFAVLLPSMAIVFVATVLAGLYPARLAVRMDPIEVVHED
jgi:putative ABC transport system permease protein